MPKFYEVLSEYYEEIFPANENKVKFILEKADKNMKILDVGAGTGNDAYEILKKGYHIQAMDLEESMVEEMKAKGIPAFCGNMLNLPNEKYDLIYCIGNTLAHLDSLKEIEEFILEVYNRLEDQGQFILQIINFEKYWTEDQNYLGSLPDIPTKDFVFQRKYFREGEKIWFHTEIQGLSEELTNDILLYPILKDHLIALLEKNGFTEIEVYSGFNKEAYSLEKDPLVLRMRKEN